MMNIAKKFVLKCNHGTGYNILVNDESSFDVEKANQLINRRMNINYGFVFGEAQYLL